MAKPSYLPLDTYRNAMRAAFDDRAERDIWKLGFDQQAEGDITGLSKLIEPPKLELQTMEAPDPLPIVVSDRPDALQRQGPGQGVAMPTLPQQPGMVVHHLDGRQQPAPSMRPGEQMGDVQITGGRRQVPAMSGGDYGPIDNSSRASFVRTAYPYMLDAANGDQNLAELMLAKAISENGDVGSGGGFIGNNFSGIKGEGDAGSFEADTWEDYGNGRVNIRDRFAAYSTPQVGFRAFMQFLHDNERYAPALQRYQQTGDASQLFRDIRAAGYATDPIWAEKVESIRETQVAPIVRGQSSQDMQRVSLNAGASPPPAAPSPAAPAGVSSAPAGAPPAPWETAGAQGGGQAFMKAEDDSAAAFAPGDGGFAPTPYEQPYDPDQGAREATPGSVGSQPLPQTDNPMTYGPIQQGPVAEGPPTLGSVELANGGQPTGNGDWYPMQTRPVEAQQQPQFVEGSMPDVSAGLKPVWDAAGRVLVPIIDAGGRVVSYLQQAATDAAIDRIMEGPRPPQSEADRLLQQSARTVTQPVNAAVGGVARSVEQSMGLPEGAALQAAQDVSGVLGPEQAINAARSVVRTGRALAQDARAVGTEVDNALRPIAGAVETRSLPGSADDAIRQTDAIDSIVLPPSTRALPEPVQQAVQTIEDYQALVRQQYERASDFSSALRNPDPVPVPATRRPDADQIIREEYGRPIQEVESRLGEASSQVRDIRDASVRPELSQREFRPEDARNIGGPVQIEPQSISLNASPGITPSAGMVADLGNALGGGVAGAGIGGGLPAETPEERRRNALIAGGVGMFAGPGVGRLLPGSGGALATFGTSPNYRPPSAARVQAAQAQGVRRGQQLNRTVSAPSSEVPLRVRAATVATDDRAAMRWAEDMLTDAAGSPRMRENDPARPSTLSRVNAGAVANERIANELEPAIVNAGRAGLQDELPQYLEDVHQLDILDEFYRRGHQEVADARAQAIATAQANGASAATIQRMQAKAQADAHAAGLRKMRQRQGSNADMTYEAIEARLKAQEQRVAAAGQKQELDDAAQAIWDHNAATRQRLVDAGEMDPADAAHYAQAYPHYVPTVPISHLDARGGQAVSASSGTRVSRGNQGVVKALEDVGTSGERLNPIVASRNATVRAERAIQRNNVARAFAQMMDDALQASPSTMGTNAATHRTFLGGGVDVTFFDNGKPVTISVPKPVADGLEAAANMGMSSNGLAAIWKRVMGAVTSTMTAARASFLPVNLLRDVQDFATRTMAREGGPQNLPAILATWADEAGRAAADITLAQMTPRGLAGAAAGVVTGAAAGDENKTPAERAVDALAGGVAGTFLLGANRVNPTAAARQFMARGGGSGALSSDWRVGQRWYRDVMRQGGVPIKTPAEMARFFADWGGDILSLQGVKGINERTELISRTAAMRRAEKGGSGPVEAMIAGRDATVDFDRAGTWARMVNGIVPFFNATVQGGAQTARAIRQNPVAFSASLAATLGPVMLGAEAWNRSDPARAAVYDDVPQYVKDTGIVVVTPWAGSDNRGERPNYVWIPTGMATPFVIGMRGAMEGLPGLEAVAGRVGTRADASMPEKWLDVFEQVAQVFSPIRGDSAASVASNFVPPIAKQVVELGQNKDMFRGNPIASDSADERASAFGRRVAEGANAAGRMVGNDFLQEVRPSQMDYLARQLPAYGDIITGASDMVAPSGYKQAEDRPIQNAPFTGGMAARFVRDTGGANIQRAQDEALSEPVREVFEAAGMRPSELTPVPSRWKNGTLTREEQLRWQDAFNAEIGRAMAGVRRDPNWRDPAKREQAVKDALSAARERAAERARLPGADVMERRIRSEQRMKAS